MRAWNNTVPEVVARYARNRHRAEFVKANPGIPEEVLAVVYFRRATNGKWWYAPAKRINFDHEPPRWEGCPYDAKWYEIPVCPEKIKSILSETREKYLKELTLADMNLLFSRKMKDPTVKIVYQD